MEKNILTALVAGIAVTLLSALVLASEVLMPNSAGNPPQTPKQYISEIGPSLEGFGMVRLNETGEPVSFSQGLTADEAVTLAFRIGAEKVVLFLYGREKLPTEKTSAQAQSLAEYLRDEGIVVEQFLYVADASN